MVSLRPIAGTPRSDLGREGKGAVEGRADGHGGPAQAVTPIAVLEWILTVWEREGEIFGQLAGVMPAQD